MATDLNIPAQEDNSEMDKMCYNCKHWTSIRRSYLYGECSRIAGADGTMKMLNVEQTVIETYMTFGCNNFEPINIK